MVILPEDGSNQVAETCRSNLNNNKLINEKLICAFRWSFLPSIVILIECKCTYINTESRHELKMI